MLQHNGRPFQDMVDVKLGTVDRAMFSDQAIYELELERIFARAWNFMAHESQIPKVGDFFLTFIGEESVICTRDKSNTFQVFLNTCRHRGNAVCRAESGNARSFLCTYHGWTFGLDGKLIGVPGYKDLYHEDLDREQWGLISAGKVASYKGFIFATMDPEAPDLHDYLGPVGRLGIDMMAERGSVVVVEGVQKNQIGCNWKLAVDNLFDFYHPAISHASSSMSGYAGGRRKGEDPEAARAAAEAQRQTNSQLNHRVILGDYGHAIGGSRLTPEVRERLSKIDNADITTDESWRDRPSAKAALGEVGAEQRGHPNIFPNLWIASGGTQLSLRLPKGPTTTEIWWFTLVPTEMTEEQRASRVMRANHTFGPAGMLEQDDGENWDQSTRGTAGVVARRYPLHYAMGVGHGQPKAPSDNGPYYIDTPINEHCQLWTYRAWAEWMDAENWASLTQHRTPNSMEVV